LPEAESSVNIVSMAAQVIIVPQDALDSVEAVLALTPERLVALRDVLGRRTVPARLHQVVANVADVSGSEAIGVVGAVRNLRRQRKAFAMTDEELLHDLREIAKHTEFEVRFELAEYKAALLGLLSPSEEEQLSGRAGSLRRALGAELLDARTVVDARPLFPEDRSRVEAFLVTVQLLITSEAASGEETTLTLALSDDDVTKLQSALTDARKKVTVLKDTLPSTIRQLE